jgi:hypothetical protein
VLHAWNGEQSVEIIDLQIRIRLHESLYGVIIMQRVAWGDDLVGPSYPTSVGLTRGCRDNTEDAPT